MQGVAQATFQLTILTQLIRQASQRAIALDRQHVLALKKPHKLVRVRGAYCVVVIQPQVPHPVRERNEFVPVNALPLLDEGLAVCDTIGQVPIAALIKLLGS
jgi:hypothetical protein